jgi:bacillithiol system protein YtxJ
MAQLKTLDTVHDLESALAASSIRPLVVLKHSLTCGTSARAHAEVQRLLADGGALGADLAVVHVQTARPVSDAIARQCAVQHESPQVLLLWNGRAAWHASHHRITARAIRAAVRQIVGEPSGSAA